MSIDGMPEHHTAQQNDRQHDQQGNKRAAFARPGRWSCSVGHLGARCVSGTALIFVFKLFDYQDPSASLCLASGFRLRDSATLTPAKRLKLSIYLPIYQITHLPNSRPEPHRFRRKENELLVIVCIMP